MISYITNKPHGRDYKRIVEHGKVKVRPHWSVFVSAYVSVCVHNNVCECICECVHNYVCECICVCVLFICLNV